MWVKLPDIFTCFSCKYDTPVNPGIGPLHSLPAGQGWAKDLLPDRKGKHFQQ